jgi:hypothetical protein
LFGLRTLEESVVRRGLSRLLFAAAIGCFTAGLWPRSQEHVDPTTGETVSELRLGLANSPIFVKTHRRSSRGFSMESRTDMWCWSMALVVAGVVGLNVAWRQRGKTSGAEHE